MLSQKAAIAKYKKIPYSQWIWQWFAGHRIDLVFCLGLGLCVLKFVSFLDLAVDIQLHDETYYLDNGVNLMTSGLPDSQWAPLYAVWYYFLSLFTRDRITLYYFNQQVLTGLTTLGLYVYLRKIKIGSLTAYFSSLFYLFSALNDVNPRPTNFALLVFIFFLIIAHYFTANSNYYSILAIAFIGIVYIRPEYILSHCFFLAIAFYFLFINYQKNQIKTLHLWLNIIFLICSIVMAIAIFGNPISGGRSWFAFGQHFALNWVNWHHSDLNPWTNWGEILQKNFGNAESLRQAIQVNPKQFFRHIFSNSDRYLNLSISLLFVSFKKHGFSVLFVHKIIFLQISLFAVVFSCIIRKWKIIWQRCDRTTLQRLSIVLLGLLISIVPAVLLIYPREHYLILQGFLIIVILTYLFAHLIRDRMTFSSSCFIAILVLFITPNIAKGWCISQNICFFPTTDGEEIVLENRKTIEFIKALEIRGKINFLEAEGGYFTYLGHSYTRIFEWWKEEPFESFLQGQAIDMILASQNLVTHPKYRDDKTFQSFLEKPQEYQFIPLTVPGTTFKLLVKQQLLNEKIPINSVSN